MRKEKKSIKAEKAVKHKLMLEQRDAKAHRKKRRRDEEKKKKQKKLKLQMVILMTVIVRKK